MKDVMSLYSAIDLSLDAIALVIAVAGGVYAVRALLLLHRNKELLRLQRKIWLPILAGGGFVALEVLVHLAGDLAPAGISSDVLKIMFVLFLIVSLALLFLGIYRYWSYQKDYENKVVARPLKTYRQRDTTGEQVQLK